MPKQISEIVNAAFVGGMVPELLFRSGIASVGSRIQGEESRWSRLREKGGLAGPVCPCDLWLCRYATVAKLRKFLVNPASLIER
jgi:hypothetical protein